MIVCALALAVPAAHANTVTGEVTKKATKRKVKSATGNTKGDEAAREANKAKDKAGKPGTASNKVRGDDSGGLKN